MVHPSNHTDLLPAMDAHLDMALPDTEAQATDAAAPGEHKRHQCYDLKAIEFVC